VLAAWAGLAAAVAALGIGAGFGLHLWRRRWLLADLPTSDAAHVFVGMNEVAGRALPLAQPIVAPYSAVECVWYRSLLEREVEDQQGRSSWKEEADVTSAAPFWVADDSGRVLVRPEGASVYAAEQIRDIHPGRPGRHSSLSLLQTLAGSSMLSSGTSRYRTTEWVIRPDEPIFVLGEATLRTDAVALEFAPVDAATGRRSARLLVSSGDEGRVARRTGWQAVALLVLAMAGAAALPAAWHAVTSDQPPVPGSASTVDAVGGRMLVGAMLVVAALVPLYAGRLYNRLVAARNRVEAAWSLIDVHLRRRHDLLPPLADVVGAALAHERDVQVAVASLRSGSPLPPAALEQLPDAATVASAEAVAAADRTATRSLLALAEAYPELRTDENARALMDAVVTAEDGVAFARTFFNDALTVMRDRRQQLPGALLAPLVPVPDMDLFQPDEPAARPASAPPPPQVEGSV
jgi:LemA protein